MSGAVTVFSTTEPAVVELVETAERDYRRFSDEIVALAKELFGPDAHAIVARWSDSICLRGFGVDGDPGALPPGWRLRKHDGAIVPHKGTKAGKVFAARMAEVADFKDPRSKLPGMPRNSMFWDGPSGMATTGRCHGHGVRLIGGTVWVDWAIDVPADKVDAAVWERSKLSTYYAAVEAQAAASLPTPPSPGVPS